MKNTKYLIFEPSFLAFDKNNYLDQLKQLKDLDINHIHFDVMDDIYVPNVSNFSIETIEEIINLGFNVSVHIMGYNFLYYTNFFSKFPIEALTFQFEAANRSKQDLSELYKSFEILESKNIKYGIAINPNTNVEVAIETINKSNFITLMSVIAGKGGQKFMPESLENLKKLKDIKKNQELIIQIDGGVNYNNLDLFINDVDRIVSGSSFMNSSLDEKQKFLKKINSNKNN